MKSYELVSPWSTPVKTWKKFVSPSGDLATANVCTIP